jgi:hypothetical protein
MWQEGKEWTLGRFRNGAWKRTLGSALLWTGASTVLSAFLGPLHLVLAPVTFGTILGIDLAVSFYRGMTSGWRLAKSLEQMPPQPNSQPG